jgi:hypothetical protein
VGNADNSLVNPNLTSASSSLLIWKEFMAAAIEMLRLPPKEFEVPPDIEWRYVNGHREPLVRGAKALLREDARSGITTGQLPTTPPPPSPLADGQEAPQPGEPRGRPGEPSAPGRTPGPVEAPPIPQPTPGPPSAGPAAPTPAPAEPAAPGPRPAPVGELPCRPQPPLYLPCPRR